MTRCKNSECGHENESHATLCAACGQALIHDVEGEMPPPAHELELQIEPFKGTPEEIERQWFEQVYKARPPGMLQLTWRAVIMGSMLGGILSLTNVYIGLKAGWAMGVAITACIASYAIWTILFRIGLAKTPMSILENNCMQSTASSAGMSTGGTLVSAFSAYVMINQASLSIPGASHLCRSFWEM